MGTLAPSDQYLNVHGLRLHYREWPNDRGRPLLLLHGRICHARYWDSFAEALQPQYRLIALDGRGHGESDHADDYSGDAYVSDAEAFVAELALSDFVLIGHSDGGWQARSYAYRHPTLLSALVLVESGLPHPESRTAADPRDPGASTLVPPPPEVFDDPKAGADAMTAFLTAYGSGPKDGSDPAVSRREWDRFHRLNMRPTPDRRWTWRWDRSLITSAPPPPAAAAPQLSYREQAQLRWREFAQISCPVLVIRGGLSGRLTRETVLLMSQRFPNVRVVEIPGAGHVVPLDDPRGLIVAVSEFLTGSRAA